MLSRTQYVKAGNFLALTYILIRIGDRIFPIYSWIISIKLNIQWKVYNVFFFFS